MKKGDKKIPADEFNNPATQSPAEKTLKNKANIKDTTRGWEDDRL
ncbi:hypothetical protein [Neobacillus niacini]|nr:hypothetical protein [Neobacillus niacini]